MTEVTERRNSGELASFGEMERAAKYVAESGLFGIKTVPQAMCVFMLCQAEGVSYLEALKRYHVIDGKPSMRADYMLAKFSGSECGVIWHIRTDSVCAATFFSDIKSINDEARKRAKDRFDLLWKMQGADEIEQAELIEEIADISREGEETIIRTLEDAKAKGLTTSFKQENGKWIEKEKTNWKQSPRQMLTARVTTEGVRLVNPGLVAGVYTPDEVEDIITNEKRDEGMFVRHALQAPSNDKVAMQKMIDQYVEESKTAKPARKSELLGLAADLRIKLDELERDEIPGITPAREVESEVLPKKVDGELTLEGESPRVKIPWQEYILQYVKPKKIQGKSLGTFSPEEIAMLHSRTLDALNPEHGFDPQIRVEAEYIKEANDHYLSHQQEMINHGDK